MRVRWVSPRPSPELPIVGQAIVATWWPGRYYFVSTIQLDLSAPIRRLTEITSKSVRTDAFVTNVYRCDKHGWCGDKPFLFERTYETLREAEAGTPMP